MGTLRQFCPAKINLFLAVTSRREDGYHSLVSLVQPLGWGDDLVVESMSDAAEHRIECDNPDVPVGPENLIWKAADLFAVRTGWTAAWRFRLTKRIPMGAGLGGGSSDGVGALVAMNRLAGGPLGPEALREIAAQLGSDCPLFLENGPVLMRGRGEVVEPLPSGVREFLAGMRYLVCKPSFSIGTAWAYGELARRAPADLLSESDAEKRVEAILQVPGRLPNLGFNSFEGVIAAKFPAIPLLLGRLRETTSLWAQMSGSGSACFFADPLGQDLAGPREVIRDAWGAGSILTETGVYGE